MKRRQERKILFPGNAALKMEKYSSASAGATLAQLLTHNALVQLKNVNKKLIKVLC
jgi:hypothetical protein